ncbi:tyrosine-type recombinase/integrase [Shouchella clausii]|uniref:tyrosine-type recombinase/integrase n=1 Tax=Shouchella clausii TaxID=79880 RepID=UPI000BA6F4D9|nr:site-specific integrase [Shouchella clausii]PAD19134.1 integrase [Shouchella clausii]
MSKKRASLVVQEDFTEIFTDASTESKREHTEVITIEQALRIITRHMKASGRRDRTISDYEVHVAHFSEVTNVIYLNQVTPEHIYLWLSSMDVSNQTKLTRLKCLKAFLNKCADYGWLRNRFWRQIQIKVDSQVKRGAEEKDVMLLLSLMDLNRFVELRDATVLLLMFRTGIRIGTLSALKEEHIDFNTRTLLIDGSILKNHQQIHLPFDETIERLLKALLKQNAIVRKDRGENNSFIFISFKGKEMKATQANSNIQKRINEYSKEYGLRNLNPHALRRGFANRLLKKNANVALISKALGHSSLDVTTRYLHLDKKEVAENLRSYL